MKATLERVLNRSRTVEREEDLLDLACPVWHRINQVVTGVNLAYRDILKDKDIDYLTAAVWGQNASVELEEVQVEIYHAVQPVVTDVLAAVVNNKHSRPQLFTLEFLIRGLIATRIAFGVESYRLALEKREGKITEPRYDLRALTPMGRA